MLTRMPQLFDITGEHDSVILAFWPDANAAALLAQQAGVQEIRPALTEIGAHGKTSLDSENRWSWSAARSRDRPLSVISRRAVEGLTAAKKNGARRRRVGNPSSGRPTHRTRNYTKLPVTWMSASTSSVAWPLV